MTLRKACLLAVATLTAALVRLGLWVLPYRAVHKSVARLTRRAGTARARHSVEHIVWAVRVASRFIPRATCLTQSLAAQVLLTRHGYPAELCLGVAREDGQFDAHAWVESNGRVVIGDVDLRRYTPI